MQINSLRFVQSSAPGGDADKQYSVLANEEEFVRCDLSRRTIAKPIALVNLMDKTTRTLSPEKKFLNKRWHLTESEDRESGMVVADGASAWLACDASANELFRVVDPRKWTAKTVETALGSWADSYAVVSRDRCVGVVRRALRPGEEEPGTRLQKLRGLLKPRDWKLELDEPVSREAAHLMIASILLLVEITVRGARAGYRRP